MNTQIFHFHKYDLKGYLRSQKVNFLSGILRKKINLYENYYYEYVNISFY